MKREFIFVFFALFLGLSVCGCGGGNATPTPTPASVSVSLAPLSTATIVHAQTVEFNATVTNDTSSAGVTWAVTGTGCTGNDCGTMTYTEPFHGHYTAPASPGAKLTVAVTAKSVKDPTKSASVTVTVWPHLTIATTSLPGGTQGAAYNTTVVNNGGMPALHWSITAGSLPAGLTLNSNTGVISGTPTTIGTQDFTVEVSDAANPAQVADQALSISVGGPPLAIVTTNLPTATLNVQYAYSLQASGGTPPYTWEVVDSLPANLVLNGNSIEGTPDSEGSFNFTVRVTDSAPLPAMVEKLLSLTVLPTAPLKEGDYAFSFSGWRIDYFWMGVGRVAIAGHFHTDGAGNITDGVQDINDMSDIGITLSQPFTGTYSINPNGHGTFTITAGSLTSEWHVAIESSREKGTFIKFDLWSEAGDAVSVNGSGSFERQDTNAFSLGALAGPFAVRAYGTNNFDAIRVAAVGRFTSDPTGVLSGGVLDMTDRNGSYQNLVLTGSFGAPSATTGRGTALVNLTPPPIGEAATYNFVYYIVSADKILLVQVDERGVTMPVLSAEARRQNGTFSVASLNAPVVFGMTGSWHETYSYSTADVGQMVPDGIGGMTGIRDENNEGPYLNQPFTGTYSVDSNGRSVMTLQPEGVPSSPMSLIAYFFRPNEAFLISTDQLSMRGMLKLQSGGPFTAASVIGPYVTNAGPPADAYWSENDSGLTTFNGMNALGSSLYYSYGQTLDHGDYTGTYSVASNGRATMTIDPNKPLVFWVISPEELVGIATVDPNDSAPVIMEYRK